MFLNLKAYRGFESDFHQVVKTGPASRCTDEVVAEIVQCGEPFLPANSSTRPRRAANCDVNCDVTLFARTRVLATATVFLGDANALPRRSFGGAGAVVVVGSSAAAAWLSAS